MVIYRNNQTVVCYTHSTQIILKGEKIMTKEEYIELKDQLCDVMIEIENTKDTLNKLYRKKEILQNKINGIEGYPLSTSIEYLFSRFDFEQSEHDCSKATVTKAKKLLLNSGYTDIRQLEGKKFSEFLGLCEGTKQLAVILSFCNKCNVKIDIGSASFQEDERIESIKYEAIRYMRYIIF